MFETLPQFVPICSRSQLAVILIAQLQVDPFADEVFQWYFVQCRALPCDGAFPDVWAGGTSDWYQPGAMLGDPWRSWAMALEDVGSFGGFGWWVGHGSSLEVYIFGEVSAAGTEVGARETHILTYQVCTEGDMGYPIHTSPPLFADGICLFVLLVFCCISVWGSFPCYLLHFGAKISHLHAHLAFGLWLVAFGFGFLRTAFGSFDVEKMQPLWHKAHVKVKMCKKHHTFGPLLEVVMLKKCTPLWREAHFEVKMLQKHRRFVWQVQGILHLVTLNKTWGYCRISKNDGRRGAFKEDLQRCIFRGRRSTRDMFIRAVRRSGRWFPERGCILEHQIFRFAEMILRDRCSTSYDLASLFRGRRSTLDRWNGNIAKRIGTRLSALHSAFHFWREVSQNCFVFDVVKFENWGSLAELLRFWRCQVKKTYHWGKIAELPRFRCCQV